MFKINKSVQIQYNGRTAYPGFGTALAMLFVYNVLCKVYLPLWGSSYKKEFGPQINTCKTGDHRKEILGLHL